MKNLRLCLTTLLAASGIVALIAANCPAPDNAANGAANCKTAKGTDGLRAANNSKANPYSAECASDGSALPGNAYTGAAPGWVAGKIQSCTCPTTQCWTGTKCIATKTTAAVACSTIKEKSACDGAAGTEPTAAGCLFVAKVGVGGTDLCVPFYNTCAGFTADASLKGKAEQLKVACAAASGSYTCAIGDDTSDGVGACVGDCNLPAVDCGTAAWADGSCGPKTSDTSRLCKRVGTTGTLCGDLEAGAKDNLQKICRGVDTGTAAGQTACVAETYATAITTTTALKCVWGG